MTRIVCVSDTHSQHHGLNIPNGDILIHAGDFTGSGGAKSIADFNRWLGTLPHPHKLVIPGNHDLDFESDLSSHKFITNARLLIHEEVTVEGLRIFGSPWTPNFCDWAFNYPEEDAASIWADIPEGIDILITHGPPYGILDKLERPSSAPGTHVGCPYLLQAVERVRPSLHVCGHIHEGHGKHVVRYRGSKQTTTTINASMLDQRYQLGNAAQTFDISPRP